jgi:cbb3-type cytochrome oxidase maturation protein
MNVIPLLVVLSLTLAGGGVALYLWSVRLGDAEHADRLSLLPLDEDLIADAPRVVPSFRNPRHPSDARTRSSAARIRNPTDHVRRFSRSWFHLLVSPGG